MEYQMSNKDILSPEVERSFDRIQSAMSLSDKRLGSIERLAKELESLVEEKGNTQEQE